MKIKNPSDKSKLTLVKINPELHEKLRVKAFKERTTMKELLEVAAMSHYKINLKSKPQV